MRNPLRSEAEAYRFLWIVVGGAAVDHRGRRHQHVARRRRRRDRLRGARLVADARAGAGSRRGSAAAGHLGDAAGHAPRARRRAARNGDAWPCRTGPRCSSSCRRSRRRREALTGAVDDRRGDAEATAAALEARVLGARAEVGADDPALAAEDALRVFGADEVLVVGDDGMVEAIRERVALPVSRA